MMRKAPKTTKRAAAATVIPFAVLLLSACVSQQQYDAVVAENNQLKAQLAASQAEQKFVEAGDCCPRADFSSARLVRQSRQQHRPKLKGLQNAKVVVYGFTGNLPVGPGTAAQGIPTIWLVDAARRRVVTFFGVARVNPNIISAKGSAIPTRSPNTRRRPGVQPPRVEITNQTRCLTPIPKKVTRPGGRCLRDVIPGRADLNT